MYLTVSFFLFLKKLFIYIYFSTPTSLEGLDTRIVESADVEADRLPTPLLGIQLVDVDVIPLRLPRHALVHPRKFIFLINHLGFNKPNETSSCVDR